MTRATIAVAMALLVVAGCGGGPSHGEVATAVARDVGVPWFSDLSSSARALEAAVVAGCDDGRLDEAREAWQEVHVAWARTRALWEGPVMARRTGSLVDDANAVPEQVEEAIASGGEWDAERVDEFLASTQRGLGALEHVLFGRPSDPRACPYAGAVASSVAVELDGLAADWLDHAATLTEEMAGRDALEEQVAGMYFALRDLTFLQLGPALGITVPEPDPGRIIEGSAGHGASRAAALVAGVSEVWWGAGGGDGVRAAVTGRDRRLAGDVDAALEATVGGFADLGDPLSDELERDPEAVEAAFRAAFAVQELLGVDVATVLDVTIGFSDTDGDSG